MLTWDDEPSSATASVPHAASVPPGVDAALVGKRVIADDKRIINGIRSYLRFIANRRAVQIGLVPLYPSEANPFPWMREVIDLKKERNFFETRVTKYQDRGSAVLGLN